MPDEISQEGIARTEDDAGIDMQANHEQVVKEKENPLASRLRQIQEAASTRTSQVTLLLNAVRQDPEIDPEEVPITWEEMNSRVDEVQAGELPNIEHVLKCQEIIKSCQIINGQNSWDEKFVIGGKLNTQKASITKIKDEIGELSKVKGLKKFGASRQIKRLSQQKVEYEKAYSDMQSKMDWIDKNSTRADEIEKRISEERDHRILSEVKSGFGFIKSEYEVFAAEVLRDGTITDEMRDEYFRTEFAFLIDEAGISAERRDVILQALRNSLPTQPISNEERQAKEGEMHKFLNDEGLDSLRIKYDFLLYNYDQSQIFSTISGLANKDIQTLSDKLMAGVGADNFKLKLYNALGAVRGGISLPPGFDKTIAGSSSDEMEIWNAFRSSKTVNEIFGEKIKAWDRGRYYRELDSSLQYLGSGDIEDLRYYPEPETVKYLVVLASLDPNSAAANRVNYANLTLNRLARRDDWEEILDKTELAYPSLSSVRPVLTNWFHLGDENNPEIKSTSRDFVVSLLDTSLGSRLHELIAKDISIGTLAEVLAERGIISDIEKQSLGDVDSVLEKAIKEQVIQSNETLLRDNIRSGLLFLTRGYTSEQQINFVKRLASLAQKVIDSKDDGEAMRYLNDRSIVKKITESEFTTEHMELFMNAYKQCPDLAKLSSLSMEFATQFTGEETVKFFTDISVAYGDNKSQLLRVLSLTTTGFLDKERALELPKSASDVLVSPMFNLAVNNPGIFLATNSDVSFFRKFEIAYKEQDKTILYEVVDLVGEGKLNRDVAIAFPHQASGLMSENMNGIRSYLFTNGELLLKDVSDLKFFNKLVGDFGSKADSLIRGYRDCLEAGVISSLDKELVLEFTKQFRVISPAIIRGYKEAKVGGSESVYIAQLTSLAEKMTGVGTITDEERAKPFYNDLLRHVYPHNSGNWTSYESNESCQDRDVDISEYTIKPKYEIDLLTQSEIRVKEGQELDAQLKEDMQAPIYSVSAKMQEAGFDYDRIKENLNEEIDSKIAEIIEGGGLSGISLEDVPTPEERLFLILTDSIYGTKTIDSETIKNLMISYEFAHFEDVREYISGTNDRVGRASNQDYALFCEVGAFYTDRIKEVNRRLVEAGWNNTKIAGLMPEFFRKLAEETRASGRQGRIDKLQVDKLGMSDGFLRQIGKTLKTKSGREYAPAQLRNIISRYEKLTGGLGEDRELDEGRVDDQRRSTIGDDEYDALESKARKKISTREQKIQSFYGQLRSQRERTFEAIRVITDEQVDPASVQLGEINLQQILEAERTIQEGRYDEDQFASYTVQRFIDLFEEERVQIEAELSKFESLGGKQREVLNATISKSKVSAHARMVGGVCVSGDNPDSYPGQNMWEMPNYFQLVLQEPDTLQCQGLIMLHSVTEGGKKVLAASLNPSSTYVYSVDESALFSGLMGTLEEFASENGFDTILLSQNKAIRTNRTGGQFEAAIDQRVASVGKTFKFEEPQQFSYHPDYKLQDMDVVWEKPAA